MAFTEIAEDSLNAVAHHLFGSAVSHHQQIRPSSEGGIPKVVGCNNNLTYVVTVRGLPKKHVFRFSRGLRDNQFRDEEDVYAVIASRTEIPTPKIYGVDTSCSVAPVPYMFMDFVEGENWRFLAHPENAKTTKDEKVDVLRKVGESYAQLHDVQRPAADSNAGKRSLLSKLGQLRSVVEDGQFNIEAAKLDACAETIERDRSLDLESESLLMADADLQLKKGDGEWEISLICDLEWVDFGDPYLDLASLLYFPKPIWQVEDVLRPDGVDVSHTRPFFEAYEAARGVDFPRLGRLAIYHQFSVICSLTDQVYREEKRAAMKAREPIYVRVIDAIASGFN